MQIKEAEKYFNELWNSTNNNSWKEPAESTEEDNEEITNEELEEALRRTNKQPAAGWKRLCHVVN